VVSSLLYIAAGLVSAVILCVCLWPRCKRCGYYCDIYIEYVGALVPRRYIWITCPLCIFTKRVWPRG
jgi:hypothetical protein